MPLTEELIEEIKYNDNIVFAVKMFRAKTSVHIGSASLWHGIDDILNKKTPRFILDNCSESELKQMIHRGFGVQ